MALLVDQMSYPFQTENADYTFLMCFRPVSPGISPSCSLRRPQKLPKFSMSYTYVTRPADFDTSIRLSIYRSIQGTNSKVALGSGAATNHVGGTNCSIT